MVDMSKIDAQKILAAAQHLIAINKIGAGEPEQFAIVESLSSDERIFIIACLLGEIARLNDKAH